MFGSAINRLKKLADNGDAVAQYELGVCYREGKQVKEDYREAVRWFLRAANQGHGEGQYNCGVAYYEGLGLEEIWKHL